MIENEQELITKICQLMDKYELPLNQAEDLLEQVNAEYHDNY